MKISHPVVLVGVVAAVAAAATWMHQSHNIRPKDDPTPQLSHGSEASTTSGEASAPVAQQHSAASVTQPSPDVQVIATAQSLVKDRLKDPESAQFRNVRRLPDGDVCGEVNSKNGFGGYVGFQHFWIIRAQSSQPEVHLGIEAIDVICKAKEGKTT